MTFSTYDKEDDRVLTLFQKLFDDLLLWRCLMDAQTDQAQLRELERQASDVLPIDEALLLKDVYLKGTVRVAEPPHEGVAPIRQQMSKFGFVSNEYEVRSPSRGRPSLLSPLLPDPTPPRPDPCLT